MIFRNSKYVVFKYIIINTEGDLAAKGLSHPTVRISVGLEDTDDLIEDITRALAVENLILETSVETSKC